MSTTFRNLEGGGKSGDRGAPSRFDVWYERVSDTPIEDLAVGDLCRAVRQQLHLEHVLPVALRHLAVDPLAGEKYDGELAFAVTALSAQFWAEHVALAVQIAAALERALPSPDRELSHAIRVFARVRADLSGSDGT